MISKVASHEVYDFLLLIRAHFDFRCGDSQLGNMIEKVFGEDVGSDAELPIVFDYIRV